VESRAKFHFCLSCNAPWVRDTAFNAASGSDEVFAALAVQYRNDGGIDFVAFENPSGPLVAVPVDSLRPRDYAGAEERLRSELESQRESLPRYIYEEAFGRLIAGIFPVCKE
jgi:hypothetical protein